MFNSRKIEDIERSVEYLKEKISKIEQERLCEKGKHEWEMGYKINADGFFPVPDTNNPVIRCKHCYVRKEPEDAKN